MAGGHDNGGAARPAPRDRGFSLVEVMVAAALMGVGVAAVMIAMQSGTNVNAAGRDLTQACYLAQEIREWTLMLPFSDPDLADQGNPPGPDGSDPQVFVDDLDDLIGVTYSPPRDGNSNPIAELANWSQQIDLEWKDPDSLRSTVAPGSTDIIRVKVTIRHDDTPVLDTGWLVSRRRLQ